MWSASAGLLISQRPVGGWAAVPDETGPGLCEFFYMVLFLHLLEKFYLIMMNDVSYVLLDWFPEYFIMYFCIMFVRKIGLKLFFLC